MKYRFEMRLRVNAREPGRNPEVTVSRKPRGKCLGKERSKVPNAVELLNKIVSPGFGSAPHQYHLNSRGKVNV